MSNKSLRVAFVITVSLTACGGETATKTAAREPVVTSAPDSPRVTIPEATAGDHSPHMNPPPPPRAPLAELQKKTMAGWVAAFNAHDTQRMSDAYEEGAIGSSPAPGGWHETKGRDAILKGFDAIFRAFPDLKVATPRIFQKGDACAIEWVVNGTNTGEFMGQPATGKAVGFRAATVAWFDDEGLIRQEHVYMDQATIAQQVGKAPGKPRPVAAFPTSPPQWITASGSLEEDKLVETAKNGWPATWSRRDAKAFATSFTDDAVHEEIASPVDLKGKDALMKEYAGYVKAMPDLTVTVDKVWAAQTFAILEFTFTGTMKGAMGPFKATNKPVTIHAMEVDEFKGDKWTKATTYSNGLELLGAMGVLPPPAASLDTRN